MAELRTHLIPTGIPLVYEFSDDLGPIRNYYLGDPERAKRAAQAVADQLKQRGLEDQFFERIALD